LRLIVSRWNNLINPPTGMNITAKMKPNIKGFMIVPNSRPSLSHPRLAGARARGIASATSKKNAAQQLQTNSLLRPARYDKLARTVHPAASIKPNDRFGPMFFTLHPHPEISESGDGKLYLESQRIQEGYAALPASGASLAFAGTRNQNFALGSLSARVLFVNSRSRF